MTPPMLMRNVVSLVWLGLIGATLLSYFLGTDHGIDNENVAGVIILFIAFFKVRLVGRYFMELRHAPPVLRLLFEGWCGVVATTVIVMFLVL